ncbi:galactose ABC transporter substrate-binding protein [Clostridium sp. C2-6-12]|uniref:galactose ABC transporter substrate-binding protein n=1 Tax=Clostridium sp. C2-6-12 TaxID=2698832 RepID=UPI00136FF93A|nr:galactose ABC transporter substrate-binding protein [Clostridium sp. C2-6-12]
MKRYKKLVIMILFITLVLTIGDSRHYVYGNQYLKNERPVKAAVFFDNENAMYISKLKGCLENLQTKNKDKVKFTFFDGKDNQSIQNESIEKALSQNFDVFIIGVISQNLRDVESTFRRVMEKNIPIILNPDPSSEIVNFIRPYGKFVVIGADFAQSGTMEGNILANQWKINQDIIDKSKDNTLQYVMLKGRKGSPLTSLRTKYSVAALNDSGIKTEEIAEVNCEWIEECAKSSIESIFLKYGENIEAIISNNDAMAIGAVKALQKYGYNNGNKEKMIPVVGIDGMPEAKEFIQKGYMSGTVVVEPCELADALYNIGINLAAGGSPVKNTNYNLDETGYTVHLVYKEYKKE